MGTLEGFLWMKTIDPFADLAWSDVGDVRNGKPYIDLGGFRRSQLSADSIAEGSARERNAGRTPAQTARSENLKLFMRFNRNYASQSHGDHHESAGGFPLLTPSPRRTLRKRRCCHRSGGSGSG